MHLYYIFGDILTEIPRLSASKQKIRCPDDKGGTTDSFQVCFPGFPLTFQSCEFSSPLVPRDAGRSLVVCEERVFQEKCLCFVLHSLWVLVLASGDVFLSWLLVVHFRCSFGGLKQTQGMCKNEKQRRKITDKNIKK